MTNNEPSMMCVTPDASKYARALFSRKTQRAPFPHFFLRRLALRSARACGMGKRRARSPSPPSSSSSSSGAVDEEVDPRQAGILDKAAAQKRAEAGEASDAPPTTAPTSAAVLARGRGREGTPEPVDDENDGENYEVRRLLRNPRYFDDDFELAAVRCFRCGGGGHREAECSRAPKTRPCHLCGDADHVARDCPRGLCFNCLRPGHRSRDCDEKRGFGRETQSLRCLRCGERGHAVGTCDADFSSKDLRQMTCYVCGASGHLCCAPMDAAAKSWDLGSRTRELLPLRRNGARRLGVRAGQTRGTRRARRRRRRERLRVFPVRRNRPHRAGVSGRGAAAFGGGSSADAHGGRRRRARPRAGQRRRADEVRRRLWRRRRRAIGGGGGRGNGWAVGGGRGGGGWGGRRGARQGGGVTWGARGRGRGGWGTGKPRSGPY